MTKRKGFSTAVQARSSSAVRDFAEASGDLARELGVRRNQLYNGKSSSVSVARKLFRAQEKDSR